MLEIEEQLRRYGQALEAALDRPTPPPPAASGNRQRAMLVGSALIALVVLAAVTTVAMANRRDTGPIDHVATTEGTFATDTGGVVLLFTDGIDGATAVDLDNRVAGRRVIEGERAGDQPFRLTIVGSGTVVVGWGEIYGQRLDGNPSSSKIDDATIYLPASEYDTVWTVTWPGGGIGQGPAALRRVTGSGDAVISYEPIDTNIAFPLLGVPGGLAVRTADGVAIWDAATGTLQPTLGPGEPTAVASDGRQLAWCDTTCATVHVAALTRTGPAPARHVSPGNQLAFDDDGTHLAILRDDALVLRDLTTGTETTIEEGLPPYGSIVWTDDGSQLFYIGRQGHLGRYVVATGRWEERDVPIGDAGGAVAITREQARSYFNPKLVPPDKCPDAGNGYPSGRMGVCSFRY